VAVVNIKTTIGLDGMARRKCHDQLSSILVGLSAEEAAAIAAQRMAAANRG